ncbi:hypothetical protein ACFQZF_08615 [Flavobacterium myungsuense]|uniref:hypothetical protein n=1 Tax=Flavobacterium myungsuense TaxID=651823 RepID=UPI0036401F36
MTYLDCSGNTLTTLDVSKNISLTALRCENNQLTKLDVSKNTALNGLVCSNNQLSYLNLKNTNLISYGYNSFTQNPNLTCIQVDDKVYSDTNLLYVKDATAFYEESCASFYTLIPDVNFENKLIELGFDSGTADGEILTSSINTITFLDVSSSNITDLTGIQDFVALTDLNCNSNQLTALDVSKNSALTSLDCANNQLTTLDLSKNTALISLYCNINQLINLNLKNTNNTNLNKDGYSNFADNQI